MGLLDGRVAVVTGAGRGIGRGEVLLLARHGASVVVNDLGTTLDGGGHDRSPAHEVAHEICAEGGSAVANADDVATWDGAAALIDQAVEQFGRLDILVNNAGFLRDRMSFNMTEDDFDAVVRVHVKGHFAPSRFAAAYWRERHKAGQEVYGRIINTTSEAGLWGTPGQSNYAMAKGAICSLTLALAREVGRMRVTVNAIAPRARKRMTETVLAGMPWAIEDFDDLDPDNVAPAVAWLASPAAGGISGHVFMVTGGRVHLLDGWSEVSAISRPGRWTVEELVARQDELFGERSRGVPEFGIGL